MYRAAYEKFRQDPELGQALAFTKGHQLVETMPTGVRYATFWGVVDGKGSNMLGQVLARIREDLATGRKIDSFDFKFNSGEDQNWLLFSLPRAAPRGLLKHCQSCATAPLLHPLLLQLPRQRTPMHPKPACRFRNIEIRFRERFVDALPFQRLD